MLVSMELGISNIQLHIQILFIYLTSNSVFQLQSYKFPKELDFIKIEF